MVFILICSRKIIILKMNLSRIFPQPRAFIDSTAAARINAYVGGHGSPEQFAREIDRLGLSERGKKDLRDIVVRRWNYDAQ